MNDIESQRRMRMAACEKAEAQKILVVKAAEAEAEAKHLSGTGVVRQKRNYTSTRAHRRLPRPVATKFVDWHQVVL